MAPKKSKKNNTKVTKEPELKTVGEIETLLNDLKDNLKNTKDDAPPEKLPEILMGLTMAVASLVEKFKSMPKATKDRERLLEDEVDDIKQRSMKGNLLISTILTNI